MNRKSSSLYVSLSTGEVFDTWLDGILTQIAEWFKLGIPVAGFNRLRMPEVS